MAVIKAERQLRKLFTHLVFQFPCFGSNEIGILRETLAKKDNVYFQGIENGVNCLFSYTVKELVGSRYYYLRPRIKEAIEYRNKIFHGQLTDKYLSQRELLLLVEDIREWCEALASGADLHVGYDGFKRNSFQKSQHQNLLERYSVEFNSVDCYAKFINNYMCRGFKLKE